MKILTGWLRECLPSLASVSDAQLAEDLTLRGIAVEGIHPIADSPIDPNPGSIFEMDITTNRVDAMNHYGIAREAAAIYGTALQPLDSQLDAPSSAGSAASPFPISIQEPALCGRFTARVLRGVSIRPSSGIVVERFGLLSQKLIFNAVDASNYVLLAMGQPTHAFDLDKIAGGQIIVRLARKGERLKTLDGIERVLESDDLIVADAEKAIGLAGVMGGWDTMITAETSNVLVEAAWFDPVAVRRSSRRHGIHSDASHRFERGADFAAAPIASALVSQLILKDGGTLEGDLVDVVIDRAAARTVSRPPIPLHVSQVQRLLGTTADAQAGAPHSLTPILVSTILTSLGCTISPNGSDVYSVSLPSWRLDLDREIDLIEEVARVYGYNRFANTLPEFSGAVVQLPSAAQERAVRSTLLGLGYFESVSSTFCSASDAALFAPQPGRNVALGNPLNEEAGCMRPSLIPGMLTMLARNLHRGVDRARLFEMGTVFSGSADRVHERAALSFGATGAVSAANAHASPQETGFFHIKGDVEELFSRFAYRDLYFDAISHLQPEWLHPGRSSRIVLDGLTVGWFGELHPAVADARKIKQPVLLGEIQLDRLFRNTLFQPRTQEISPYPAVDRDFSFIFSDTVQWAQIAAVLDGLQLEEMIHYQPQEIYRDPKGTTIPRGRYSILVRSRFQSTHQTLSEVLIQRFSEQVVAALTHLGGELRSEARP